MTPEQRESEAAADLTLVAIGHALRYAASGDVSATALAILVAAVELLSPDLSPANRAALFQPTEE